MHITIQPSVLYFGTPVVMLSTTDRDGVSNLTPISSAWALGDTYVLGLGTDSRAYANLCSVGELVVNLPESRLVDAVERVAPTTGLDPVPAAKRPLYRHESDKWSLGGFTRVPSDLVAAPRVAECAFQMEARVTGMTKWAEDCAAVFAEVVRVHARADLVIPGTSYIDTTRWQPLYYTFRHYFTQGADVGRTFKADH